MKFNNGVQMALAQASVTKAKYSVIPRDGRFLICRRLTMTDSTFDVVDDCRTEGFANRRAEALNNRLIQEPNMVRAYARLLAAPIPQQPSEPKFCKPCRDTGLLHCSDPENCGGPWTTPAPQPKE